MPLVAAPMPCSRTPKWTLRPANSSGKNSPAPSNTRLLLLDLARSAEPPTSQGIFWARAFRVLPELSRVAMPLGSAGKAGRLLSQPSGRSRDFILVRCEASSGYFLAYSAKSAFHDA